MVTTATYLEGCSGARARQAQLHQLCSVAEASRCNRHGCRRDGAGLVAQALVVKLSQLLQGISRGLGFRLGLASGYRPEPDPFSVDLRQPSTTAANRRAWDPYRDAGHGAACIQTAIMSVPTRNPASRATHHDVQRQLADVARPAHGLPQSPEGVSSWYVELAVQHTQHCALHQEHIFFLRQTWQRQPRGYEVMDLHVTR